MERHTPDTLHESMNVFDDEFAVDDFDVVADGFAPGRVGMGNGMGAGLGNGRGNSRRSVASSVGFDLAEDHEPPVRSVAAHMADMSTTGPTSPMSSRYRGNRNSIRKSRTADNPFRSAEDEDDDGQSSIGRSPSVRSQSTATTAYAPGITHRSASSTSSRPFAPTPSSFQGASGPSHPYAMYPQDTNLARTASVSTTSTIRPSRPLMGDQQGPAHPYSMYPQNVAEGDEDAQDHGTTHAQAHIPVGFPGRSAAYNVAHGPQGEEQDIIGVDGHTEQLPPYSEYPEDGVPKHIVLPGQAPATTSSSDTRLNVPLIPGRPQSMSDAGSRANPQAFANMEQMESNDSTLSAPKRWRDKSWKEKRKTKFCGIPFWWILLSMCVLVFIAAVLGGAIGGFMSGQKKSQDKRPQHMLPSSTSLFDASPIPTSSTGSPPPTGTYALTLSSPEAVQSACLTNTSYNLAWSCDIPSPQALGISIENPPSSSSGGWQGACLLDTSETQGYSNISYGTQTPSTSFSQFIAVTDNDDPDRGPAFYFQAFYDKVVVAAPNALPYGSLSSKRDAPIEVDDQPFRVPSAWYTRHQISAGEQPWFCYWNGTFIEGFIYSANNSESSPSSAPSTSSPPSASSTSASSFTATPSSLPSSRPSTTWGSTGTYAGATPSSSWSSRAANIARGYDGDYYNQLPQFEYVVKIEERRIPGSPQPYCQKMQILDDGTAGVVTDPNTGKPIQVALGEEDPGYSAYQSSSSSSPSSSERSKRADTTPGGCHCQWWSGV